MPRSTDAAEPVSPLLASPELDQLREALEPFTPNAAAAQFGLRGSAALDRGDLAGAARALRSAPDARLADLASMFLVGGVLDEVRARRAFAPLTLEAAVAAGLAEASAGEVRAALEIRPYAETSDDAGPWWVVSDLGADARPGPLAADHVLGVGSASLSLARATPRRAVGSALDVGTGCGVQALHLARHSTRVTATDVSARALRFAATTAALSGQNWDLRRGSLLEPVAGERFDLIVANPPFVVSDGTSGLTYRDSGLAGDAVCETLLRTVGDLLGPGGTAVLLANWMVGSADDWAERVGGWLADRGCDAWVWQRELAGPEEYVSLWLRDAGLEPSAPGWADRYDAWCDWFERQGVAAVGMGLVTLWRSDDEPLLVFDDVRQAVEQPVADEIAAWHDRARWLREATDESLLSARLRPAPGLVRSQEDLLGTQGWQQASLRLRQSHGLRWEIDADDAVTRLIAGCATGAPLGTCVDLLETTLGPVAPGAVVAAVLPVVRDLVARGMLLPDLPAGRSAPDLSDGR